MEQAIAACLSQAIVRLDLTVDEQGISVADLPSKDSFDDDVCALCDYSADMRAVWREYKRQRGGFVKDMYAI